MTLRRRQFVTLLGGLAIARTGAAAQHGHAPTPVAKAAPPAAKPPVVTAPAGSIDKVTSAAEEVWTGLLEGNRRFVEGTPLDRELVTTRSHLQTSQHPKAIILGCADSRVGPELVFDQNLGDLFVVRTAGNIADTIALGSLEYAIEHLHVPLIVVLGHEKCGAVNAAIAGEKMPTPNLDAIVKRIAGPAERLKMYFKGDQLSELVVQANVQQSASDIVAASKIVSDHVRSSKLSIIRAMYQLSTGEVVRLA